jgi:histidine triad (HIT) family protein
LSECIFCKIVRGEIPATKVYEDDQCMAFHDINPQAPVHVLVIPKKHIPSAMALSMGDAALLARMFTAIRNLAGELKVDESGFRVITNAGPDAQQTVHHLHFHLLGGRKLDGKLG